MKFSFKISRKKVKSLWLLLWRKDAFIFLLFVGLTSIFWWGHVMSSSRDMNLKVTLVYTGIPSNTFINKDLPSTLTMIVRDEGKQLRQLSRNNHHININLADFLSQEKGEVRLTTDILRPRLQDLLPGSTQIQKINPEEIVFTYENQFSKTVPVVLQANIQTAPQHLLVGDAKVTPKVVQVFGDKETLDSIQYIYTENIQVTELRDSVCVNAQLVIPQNTRVRPDQITIECNAEQFTEKSFNLPVTVIGNPNGGKLRLFPKMAEVTIHVCMSNFSLVQASDIQLVCHYPKHESKSLPIKAITSNPYIHNIRISPSSVEYIIER